MVALWAELLGEQQTLTLPWLGGGALLAHDARRWRLRGRAPQEHGWYQFRLDGARRASLGEPGWPDLDALEACPSTTGYLVGDRLIPDGARVEVDPGRLVAQSHQLHLVEPGLERFARVRAAQWPGGAWIYMRQEFPLGPEPEVQAAFVEHRATLDGVRGVTPALALAFHFEGLRRHKAEARRRALELQRQAEERRLETQRLHGTGAGRRELAARDFHAAARAALAVAGAQLLDVRPSRARDERVVQFRFQHRAFECVVEAHSLRIVDAGICLVDHNTGERGDNYFTLESLPAVIEQASRERRLVIFRHV